MAVTRTTAISPWGHFESYQVTVPFRLIWRSEGPEKSGKTHFGLTAPGPIAIQCFDALGLEGTAEKFREAGKDVRVCKYKFDKNNDTQQDACRIRDQFSEDFELALQNARTVIWDETELWTVFRYAEFGAPSDAPKNYDKLNFDYAELIHRADEAPVNLQLIQKVKEAWITVDETDKNGKKISRGKPSGEMKAAGFKEARYIVQANFKHTWDHEQGFGVQVVNCRQNMELAGETFYNTTFGELAQLIFSASTSNDWI